MTTASDEEGNSLVGYTSSRCLDDDCSSSAYAAYYMRGTVAGGLSAPVKVADTYDWDLAMNEDGDAVVLWRDATTVRARVASADGDFGSPLTIAEPGSYLLDVAMGGDGTIVALWHRSNVLRAAVKPAGAAAFGSARDVSTTTEGVRESRVAVDVQGNATIAWIANDYQVRAVTKAASGGFGLTQTVSSATDVKGAIGLAASSSRRATVVWNRFPNTGTSAGSLIEAAASDTTGSFGEVEGVSPGDSFGGAVAVDKANRAVAVWRDGEDVYAATRGSTGAFGEPAALSSPAKRITSLPAPSFDEQGNALVLWSIEPAAGMGSVVAARRSAGGSFGEPEILSAGDPYSVGPSAAFDADGNGLVVYSARSPESAARLRAVGLDASGPRLRSVSVPAGGTEGDTLAFSVDAFDRWSGATTTWDFGDGSHATGKAVSHAYAQAGAYVVTIAVEDALGQRTTATRVVGVQPRQSAGGGGGGTGGGGASGGSSVAGTSLQVIGSTVAHGWMAYRRYTIARRLAVTNLPAGATVTVTRKAKRRCPKARRVTTTFPRARLDLVKPFRKKQLPVGARVTVAIAAPGVIGKVVSFTIRRRALPAVRTLCRPPGGRPAACV